MESLIETLENLSFEESLIYLSENYGKVVFSSSFGQEDQVIISLSSSQFIACVSLDRSEERRVGKEC